MRIKSLWISEYKNLNNFTIEFDTSSPLNIIIGANGSGKSNFLEALSRVFKFLYFYVEAESIENFGYETTEMKKLNRELQEYLKNMFKFKLELEENINEEKVVFEYFLKEKGEKYHFITEQKNLTSKQEELREKTPYYRDDPIKKIPKNIYLYDSGNTSRTINLFKEFEKNYYGQLRNNENIRALPRMINFDSSFGKYFILIAYIYKMDLLKSTLKEVVKIKDISNIEIKFSTPPWYRNVKESRQELKYWGLEDVKALEIIDDYFICTPEKNDLGLRTIFKNAKLIESEKLEEIRGKLESEYVSPKQLLESFYNLHLLKLIENVDLEILNITGESFSYDNLSEGQKQLITILGLTAINSESNTMFLFDEPDTFLHPKWQREFSTMISKFNFAGSILLTSHSPLTLSALNNKLNIIEKGKIKTQDESRYYSDINTILEEIMMVNRYPDEISFIEKQFYEDVLNNDVEKAKLTLSNLKGILKSKNIDEEDHDLVLELSGMIYRMELLGYEENN